MQRKVDVLTRAYQTESTRAKKAQALPMHIPARLPARPPARPRGE